MTARTASHRKGKPPLAPARKPSAEIRLQNPVSNHFEAFIFGNSTICQRLPQHPKTEPCDERCTHVAEQDSAKGQHVVICGAGPTLRETAPEWVPQGDQVWGCNSALTYLLEHGYPVTHGFTVDQTAEMLNEWRTTPDVEYLLASSVHPHLTELLIANGRRTRFFHNYVGISKPPVSYDGETMAYEDWMYAALYPGTVRAGAGLNAVTRAIDVARYMGFAKITVLGADCALRVTKPCPDVPAGSPEHMAWLRDSVEMHADGGHALASGATAVTVQGEIDGRLWTMKPDLAISGVFLARMANLLPEVNLVGDTFPNAIRHKGEAYLDTLPCLTDSDGTPIRFIA